MEGSNLKITAGIIVLNEEFWLKLQLQYIYNFFDEIIICEGAEIRNKISNFGAVKGLYTDDGLSIDRTFEIIKNFPDPDNKIIYHRYGFCNNKNDMFNWIYENATCDYLWHIDADEFYYYKVMKDVKEFLINNTDVNQINFRMYHFWGSFDDCIHGVGGKNWGDNVPICRVFRVEQSNKFISHRPPTIKYYTPGKIINRDETYSKGWVMYHYGYVFEWQLNIKEKFYPDGDIYRKCFDNWKKNKNAKLIKGSQTIPFENEHPEIIQKYLKGEI